MVATRPLKLYRFVRFHTSAMFEAEGFRIPANRDLQVDGFMLASSKKSALERLGGTQRVIDLREPIPGFRNEATVRAILQAHPDHVVWKPLTLFEDRFARMTLKSTLSGEHHGA